jgi:hypothetical protein
MFPIQLLSGLALFGAAVGVSAAPAVTTANDQASLSMTVYQQGLALIRDERTVDVPLGRTLLSLVDVSNQIIAESILVTGQGLALHGAAYARASLTADSLLASHIGESVRVMRHNPQTGDVFEEDGVLLGASGGVPIVNIGGRIETGGPTAPWWLAFDAVPEDLQAKDTLTLDLDNNTRGPQSLSLAYLSRGLSWQANYVGSLRNDNTLSFSGWVSVDNGSNTRYTAARIQLLAGDINQASGFQPMMAMARQESVQADMASSPVGDYHLYDLPDAVTLLPNQSQQVRLLETRDVPVEREYRVEGDGSRRTLGEASTPVAVRLHLENSAPALGKPLPAGLVRVYAADSRGMSQFLGEDRINHTAKGQPVTLRVGNAFDVQARKTTVSFQRVDSKTTELEQKIRLSNTKDSPITVVVAERLPGEWDVLSSSDRFDKASAALAEWRLEVPANSEKELTYHVRIRH